MEQQENKSDIALWDLWEQIQKELGIDLNKRMVRNDELYWNEYDLYELDSDKKEIE